MNKQVFFCASMMCANLENIKREVSDLEEAGIDIFHLDVMDGHYVNNFGLSPQDIQAIRSNSKKPIDVHLMISDPEKYVDFFADLGVNIIYIHMNENVDLKKTLLQIKSRNIKAGLAINPTQPLSDFEEYYDLIDILLVMTVTPGFAGQKFIPEVVPEIKEVLESKRENSFSVFVDGAVSPEVVLSLSLLGVDGFILGTSTLFNQSNSYKEILNDLKKKVNKR